MRDPYHSARQRFKVARDRCIDRYVLEEAQANRIYHTGYDQCGLHQRHLQRVLTLEYLASLSYPDACPGDNEAIEAAGILITMERFKITDERRALMLWKLSRE